MKNSEVPPPGEGGGMTDGMKGQSGDVDNRRPRRQGSGRYKREKKRAKRKR